MKLMGKILYLMEKILRRLYSKIWYYRIVLTTNLQRKTNVRRIKSRSKRM
jgi:hypothetical protein